MEQQTGSKLENDYLKAGYCHPVYLTYIWSASCESQAEIKIAGRNTNNLRCTDDTTLMAENEEELKSLLMRVKEKSKNAGLKFNVHKTKIMASGPITSQQIEGGKWKQ